MSAPVNSPIESLHVQDGASLVEYHGALVPSSFSGAAREHHAVRTAAGIFDFSFRARFTAKGSDRTRFLQGMVSNDVKKLEPGQGVYATMLDTRGHILFDTRIYCAPDFFILETDADLAEKAIQALSRYNVGGRVPLEPDGFWAIAFQGPASRRIVEACLQTSLPALKEYDFITAAFAEQPAYIVRASSTGEEGYEVWTSRDAIAGLWRRASAKAPEVGALPCGVEALETLRIEAGIPRYSQELAEDTLPLEAGLLNALSFNKGCYIGQEIVERARSRGHVNWKLVGLIVDSSQVPMAGEKLRVDSKDIGEITSACVSPSLGRTIALAYVRREHQEPATKLALSSGSAAEVTPLPFYQPAETPGQSQTT
ncbi:MAG: aminomethyltransferase family protein [Terriglobia bacterium]